VTDAQEPRQQAIRFLKLKDLRGVGMSAESPASGEEAAVALLATRATEFRRCLGIPATISRALPRTDAGGYPFWSSLQVSSGQLEQCFSFKFVTARSKVRPGHRLQLQWEPVRDAALALADLDLESSTLSPGEATDGGFSRTSAGRLLPPTEVAAWPSLPRPPRSKAAAALEVRAEPAHAAQDLVPFPYQRQEEAPRRVTEGKAFLIRPSRNNCASAHFRFSPGPPPLRYFPLSA